MELLPHLHPLSWLAVMVGGITIGLSKSGFSGISILGVVLFAEIFPPRESTGIMLLSLIVGDFCSVLTFHRQADWAQLRRVILPAIAGVVLGWLSLQNLSNAHLRPLLGVIIIGLTIMQALRQRWTEHLEHSFHGPWFAWAMGGLGGWTTMVANAAGPVMSLFFLSMRLPKLVFVGTSAWFFLGINLIKVPFSTSLGLIHWYSLGLAIVLTPVIYFSVHLGRWLLQRVSQKLFESLILIFAIAGAIRLIWF